MSENPYHGHNVSNIFVKNNFRKSGPHQVIGKNEEEIGTFAGHLGRQPWLTLTRRTIMGEVRTLRRTACSLI